MRHAIAKLMFHNRPIRAKISKEIVKRFSLFPYEIRVEHSAIDRPHYGYCVLQAAKLAKRLGHKKISIIEFGVAGGNGLVNLEMHAAEVKKLLGVDIQIFGFDTGQGLPPPVDYRDVPYHWKPGFFQMDIDRLKAKLKFSTLVIGNVADTLTSFVEKYKPAPIAAIFMDLDYYSSTKDAFKLFDIHRSSLLPRAFIYFDDIIGDAFSLLNEYNGVLLAIDEFNSSHPAQKICKMRFLGVGTSQETWHHQIYGYHDYESVDYSKFVSEPDQQLKLRSS